MLVPRSVVLASLVGVVTAVALLLAVGASGGDGSKLFRSTLAPSLPTDPKFHDVGPGGVPWQLTRGEVRIKTDGEFDLEVRGLVIPSRGDADGVVTVSASLFCGADANATAADTTPAVPLSSAGDAEIGANLSLPSTCLAPIVLVHPNGNASRYIALSGWRS